VKRRRLSQIESCCRLQDFNGFGRFAAIQFKRSRAPYFHNGSAATLADVLVFYDMRFNIGFTSQEKAI